MGRIVNHIRSMRKKSTRQEKRLWALLRDHQVNGYTFRRQHRVHMVITPLGVSYFVADFCCIKLKLIIELDGVVHENDPEYDKTRQAILEGKGYTCLRFTNDEIDYGLQDVVNAIATEVTRLHDLRYAKD